MLCLNRLIRVTLVAYALSVCMVGTTLAIAQSTLHSVNERRFEGSRSADASAPAHPWSTLRKAGLWESDTRRWPIHFVNEYLDNPRFKIDLSVSPQFNIVGKLVRDEPLPNGQIKRTSGSAVIVSPCYILTNHHVVFGEDLNPIAGKSYRMIFRAGIGGDVGGFAGHTEADPVLWGQYDGHNQDWAVLHLKNCVGTLPQFGWAEFSHLNIYQVIKSHSIIAIVGYSYQDASNQSSISIGHALGGSNRHRDLVRVDASMTEGQSGGGVFVVENGMIKLVGINVASEWSASAGKQDKFAHWDADSSNLVMDVYHVLQSDVAALIWRDQANWKAGNPALMFQSRPMPHPPLPIPVP